MFKKFFSLILATIMISGNAYAATDIVDLYVTLAEEILVLPTFSYATSDVSCMTEAKKDAEGTLLYAVHERVEDLPTWDGYSADSITGGTGTKEDPYLISDGGELAYFAKAVSGLLTDDAGNAVAADKMLCAKLDRDINLAKEDGSKNNWASFAASGYKGVFDGQGHNIYNMYFVESSSNEKGFFRTINAEANLKNFNLIDARLTTNATATSAVVRVGVVCGNATSDETSYNAGLAPVIENVYVSGTAKLYSDKRINIYGSIVGNIKYADVRNCFSSVDVDCSGNIANLKEYSGGANVNGSSIGIGGVVGVIAHDRNLAKITNCGNAGKIYAPDNRRVGGVIGAIGGNSSLSSIYVDNIYNYGDVDGIGQVGGCVGWLYNNKNGVQSTTRWYNTGNITAHTESETWAAGIVNGYCTNTDKTFGGTLYSAGDVRIAVKDAETGEVSYKYNDKCALISCGMAATSANIIYRNDLDKVTVTNDNGTPDDTSDDTQSEPVDKWTTRSAEGVTGTYGTGKTLGQIKALTADEVSAYFSTRMVADFGINGGMPVLTTQKDNLILDEETYEISNIDTIEKYIEIEAKKPGFVALDVTAIAEKGAMELGIYKQDDTKITDVAVSGKGLVFIPTDGETSVVVKATEGSRILVKEASEESLNLENIKAAPIRVNLVSDESASIYIALFDGTKLEKITYLADVESAKGYVSGVIDLTGCNVEGRILRAYLWRNGIIAPMADVQEL